MIGVLLEVLILEAGQSNDKIHFCSSFRSKLFFASNSESKSVRNYVNSQDTHWSYFRSWIDLLLWLWASSSCFLESKIFSNCQIVCLGQMDLFKDNRTVMGCRCYGFSYPKSSYQNNWFSAANCPTHRWDGRYAHYLWSEVRFCC